MNNLHRELAPISEAAWHEIEEEARRTFRSRSAARRVVDMPGAAGYELSAVGTGHTVTVASPASGVLARRREVQPVLELRVPFFVSREAVDDVARGAGDSDWQPVKDAATQIATAEDRIVFTGADGITGVVPASTNAALGVPDDVRELPSAVSEAISALRLAGVEGPYTVLLSADLYTAVAETTHHGVPLLDHLARILADGRTVWAPAIDGAIVLSERGGDYELRLGQDLSIGYLSHDEDEVRLYLQETLTFRVNTAEAAVAIR